MYNGVVFFVSAYRRQSNKRRKAVDHTPDEPDVLESTTEKTICLFESEIPRDHVRRRFVLQNLIKEAECAFGRTLFESFDVDRLLFSTCGFTKSQIVETIGQAVEAKLWEEEIWGKDESPLISAGDVFHQAKKLQDCKDE